MFIFILKGVQRDTAVRGEIFQDFITTPINSNGCFRFLSSYT